jgi:hypothetical protein
MIELVATKQVQVLAFALKRKVLGQLQAVVTEFQTKFFIQAHTLLTIAPVA